MSYPRKDWTGFKFKEAEVINYIGQRMVGHQNHSIWAIRCGCGEVIERSVQHMNQAIKFNKGFRCDQCLAPKPKYKMIIRTEFSCGCLKENNEYIKLGAKCFAVSTTSRTHYHSQDTNIKSSIEQRLVAKKNQNSNHIQNQCG